MDDADHKRIDEIYETMRHLQVENDQLAERLMQVEMQINNIAWQLKVMLGKI